METVNINASGYRMKGSPMQRNFNIGIATETGAAGLAPKDSPMKWAFLLAIGKAIAAGAKAVGTKIAAGAAKVGAGIAKTVGAKGVAGKLGSFAGKMSKASTGWAKAMKGTYGSKAFPKISKSIGNFTKSKAASALGSQMLSNMASDKGRKEEKDTSISTAISSMSYGSPFSLNKNYQKYKAGTTKMQEYLSVTMPNPQATTSAFKGIGSLIAQKTLEYQLKKQSPTRNYKKGYYGA